MGAMEELAENELAEEIAAKLTGPDGEVQDPRAVLVAHVPGAGSLAANTVKSSGL